MKLCLHKMFILAPILFLYLYSWPLLLVLGDGWRWNRISWTRESRRSLPTMGNLWMDEVMSTIMSMFWTNKLTSCIGRHCWGQCACTLQKSKPVIGLPLISVRALFGLVASLCTGSIHAILDSKLRSYIVTKALKLGMNFLIELVQILKCCLPQNSYLEHHGAW